ncbi:MAG: tandem-95 repeat protein, partial [Verrucomicrobiaceae bacterium]
TLVSLSGTSPRYTLDGTDPRPFGGGVGTGTAYSGAIAINQTTVLTVRSFGARAPFPGATSINWGPPRQFVYLVDEEFAAAGDIVVSEINYNPLAPTSAELAAAPGITADDFEFVELRNIGSRKVNLFEARFAQGSPLAKDFKLQAFSLSPGEFAVIVKNRAAFTARYGAVAASRIAGEWVEGNLPNGGGKIELIARDNSVITSFTYDDSGQWPGRPDGKGSSLEYIGTIFTNAAFGSPANWRASGEFQGSPGVAGTGPDARVVINEVLSHSNAPRLDAIELKNLTPEPINIGGWYISDVGSPDSPDSFRQFRIPDGSILPGNGYLVFTEEQFNPNGTWNPAPGIPGAGEFAFDAAHGDDAWLLEADSTGNLLKFVDHVDFGAALADESWGRFPDGTGSLYPMASRTLFDESSASVPLPGLGAPNSTPRFGPLIISEIHHTPIGGNSNLEFIEIFNPTGTAQSLDRWRIGGKVEYDFLGYTLQPRSTVVIVPFNPANAAATATFRDAYGISESVILLGPWSAGDKLSASGEVVLSRAGTPPVDEPFFVPRTIEDEANYLTGGEWPASTGSNSLTRARILGYGDNPSNWIAKAASPGSFQLNEVPSALTDNLHPPYSGTPLSLDVRANDTDPDGDLLTITGVTAGANGTTSTDGSTVTYTPGPNFSGTDTFTYTVEDGFGGAATATVTLTNTIPVAANDNFHPPLASAIALDVLANDSDPDGDPRTILSVGSATHGTVSIEGGNISYIPGATFIGADTFTYTIGDGFGGMATATVALQNSAPLASDDVAEASGGAVTIDVLVNDSDLDGDSLVISDTTAPAYGTVSTAGGSITYTPGAAFAGDDQFSYTIVDGHGGVATASVIVRSMVLLTRDEAATGEEVEGMTAGTRQKILQTPAIGQNNQLAWLATTALGKVKKQAILSGRPARMIAAQGELVPGVTGGARFTKLSH